MDVPLNDRTRKTNCVRRISITRRIKPKKNFVQNSFLEVKGWLKRKDFVFLINSLVKEVAPSNREKRIGEMKKLKTVA